MGRVTLVGFAGMCGTAAVVVKVASITRGSKTYEFPTFDTMAGLRGELTAIQHGVPILFLLPLPLRLLTWRNP